MNFFIHLNLKYDNLFLSSILDAQRETICTSSQHTSARAQLFSPLVAFNDSSTLTNLLSPNSFNQISWPTASSPKERHNPAQTSINFPSLNLTNDIDFNVESPALAPPLASSTYVKLFSPSECPNSQVKNITSPPAPQSEGQCSPKFDLPLLVNPFRYERIKGDNNYCHNFTGLKPQILDNLIAYVKKGQMTISKRPPALPIEDQIILTLVRLRQNSDFMHLACIIGISSTTVAKYFHKWLNVLYFKLKPFVRMQDRKDIHHTIPSKFKSQFPRFTCIIDCFEVFIQKPSPLKQKAQTYSNYKGHNTLKVLISCSPLGIINYIFKGYGGRASDKFIILNEQFHTRQFHKPGDQILADRGFTCKEDFAVESRSELIIPAFTKGKQLSNKDVEETRRIASTRIHIERVIGALKYRYKIIGPTPIKLSTLKTPTEEALNLVPAIDKILMVTAGLYNLGTSNM